MASSGDKRRNDEQVPADAPAAKKAKYALPEKPDISGMTEEDGKAAEAKYEKEKRSITLGRILSLDLTCGAQHICLSYDFFFVYLANRHLDSAGQDFDWSKAKKVATDFHELQVDGLDINLKKPAEPGKSGFAVNQNWFDLVPDGDTKKKLQIEWNGHISRSIAPNRDGGVNVFVIPETAEDDAKWRAIQVHLKKRVTNAPKEWKPAWTDAHMEFQNMVYVQNPTDPAIREKHKENPIVDMLDETGKPIECYPSSVKVKVLEAKENKDPKKKNWKPKVTRFVDVAGKTLNPAKDFEDGTPVTVHSQLSSGYYDNKAKGQPPKKKWG